MQRQRHRDIGQVELRTFAQRVVQTARLGPQRGSRPRGQQQRQGRRARWIDRPRRDRGRLFEDHVRVGPADPERRHSRPARTLPDRPRLGLGQDPYLARRPLHVRRRRVNVQGGRQHLVPQRLHHLDHTADTGSRLSVPDVRLQRPDPQRLGALLSVGVDQRLRLDRVTQCGAGAVRLHRVHLGRGHPCVDQCLRDHPLLGRTVGCGQAVARTVLVDCATADHGQHRAPVALRVGQPLEGEHADALGPRDTVRSTRERLAAPIR